MTSDQTGMRVAGAWLAAASLLLVLALAFHGPLHPDLQVQMTRIGESASRWAAIHWTAAAAFSCYVIAAVLVLVSRSRLTSTAKTISAWAVVLVGALWTLTTAVTEVTVIADLAASRDLAQFEASRLDDVLLLGAAHAVPEQRRLAEVVTEALAPRSHLVPFDPFSMVHEGALVGTGDRRTAPGQRVRMVGDAALLDHLDGRAAARIRPPADFRAAGHARHSFSRRPHADRAAAHLGLPAAPRGRLENQPAGV